MTRRTIAVLTAIALTLGAAGCGRGTGGRTLTVLAAASLTETFTALGKEFEAANPGVGVRLSFGGSSELARQAEQGAPADVLATADTLSLRPLVDRGLTSGAVRVFARNRLVIAVPPGNPARVRRLPDLGTPGLKVVLCTGGVPCGDAAAKVLESRKIELTPASWELNVKSVLTKVRMREADAGLVYRTDVRAAGGAVEGIEFPESAQAINEYPIVVLRRAELPDQARRFAELVLSPRGRQVLAEAGFETP